MAFKFKEVIVRPLITEKGTAQAEGDVYVFEVNPAANKHQIAQAVRKLFSVEVLSVRTANFKGKKIRLRASRRLTSRKKWKKAYVKVAPGAKLEGFALSEGDK